MEEEEKRNSSAAPPLRYEPPRLEAFSYGALAIANGFSGLDCPPRDPLYEDDYGGDI